MAIAINDHDVYSGSFVASHTLPDIDCSGTDTYALALGVNRNPGSDVSSWAFEGATPDNVAEFINAGTNSLQVKGDVVNDADLTIVCNTPTFKLQSIIGVSFTGVDQSTPIAGKSTEKNEFTDNISDSYTGTAGNLLMVFITTQTDKTFTPTNCTALATESNPDANLGSGFVGYVTATGSSQTIGASWTGSLVAAIAIVEVAAAASGDDHTITSNDIALSLTEDNTTLAQNHIVAVQDMLLSLREDNTTITQNHILVTQDITLSLSEDNTTVAQNHTVVTQDITLSTTIDNTTITQNHVLPAQDITLSTTTDNTTINQNHVVSAQDILLSTTTDEGEISLAAFLDSDDSTLSLSIDNTTIAQNHIIVANDIALSLTTDSTTITQNHVVAPADLQLSTTTDNTSTDSTTTLLVNDSVISLSIDSTTISQSHVIVTQDILISTAMRETNSDPSPIVTPITVSQLPPITLSVSQKTSSVLVKEQVSTVIAKQIDSDITVKEQITETIVSP